MNTCTIDACTRPTLARGLCAPHYSTWHRQQRKHAIVCAHCGAAAQVGRPRMRYCSTDCSNRSKQAAMTSAATAARTAARQRRRLPVIYTGPPSEPATHEPIHRRRFKSGQCRVCSTWFVSLNTDLTCSKECWLIKCREDRAEHKSRRRARRVDAYVADVWRKQVFERDGYRCHLCSRRTQPNQPVPHPRAPTIDHVIPLAAGGTHEPLNCRTACYLCNARKGDRGGGEQLLLIA